MRWCAGRSAIMSVVRPVDQLVKSRVGEVINMKGAAAGPFHVQVPPL